MSHRLCQIKYRAVFLALDQLILRLRHTDGDKTSIANCLVLMLTPNPTRTSIISLNMHKA